MRGWSEYLSNSKVIIYVGITRPDRHNIMLRGSGTAQTRSIPRLSTTDLKRIHTNTLIV